MNQQQDIHPLEKHFFWFKSVLDLRITQYFEPTTSSISFPEPPILDRSLTLDDMFASFQMGWEEQLIVLLALVPHLRPQLLDIFFTNNENFNRGFTEFGGIRGKTHSGFIPTMETAVFIISGTDLKKRIEIVKIFQAEHYLFQHQILEKANWEPGEPFLSSPLYISKSVLPKILWDEEYRPDFGPGFPAKRVTTSAGWEDLILAPYVMEQILEIKGWLENEHLIQEDWGLRKIIKPGFKSLFFGPPGTGKTFTASLLGKALSRDVYRIDLSMVISKYIGETEKNLANVFDQAEQKNWILFFDEADALFGKRTVAQSSHDRYANQEVAYLLQRLEDYPGLVILASNFKGNLDEAFVRRFQTMIHFPVPGPQQRFILWKKAFSLGLRLSPEVDLNTLAEQFEVTGGEIVNILRHVAINTARRNSNIAMYADIVEGIKTEFQKNGRILSP